MFRHLVNHGCADLSLYMDPEQYSSGLIVGGGFGDIWKGKLRDGTEVAIKVWRFSSLSLNGPKSMKVRGTMVSLLELNADWAALDHATCVPNFILAGHA